MITSTRPTTAMLAASTTARTPARCIRWPGAAEEFEVGVTPPQRFHQAGGVQVARGFAGGDQYFLGH